ncbi:uncharacterized protein B0I36DRAFT_233805 [Microdochium trichocladiopsis]|uniref:Pre-rRNA processing protein n=1 Tax=Microdochium trichocladiopsis TaxID=1682393 RepID=A0A9P9BTX9_9PEZI|nr:uncharacterized protein B0I36DRAFT_233805 [Microdochium trichocladiopsis]KAH7040451.1 hypothetical protein B0I36DRAFT_233805 [Microdochium trichocladiopsis]
MASDDESSSPLLAPAKKHNTRAKRGTSSESTPLLADSEAAPRYDGAEDDAPQHDDTAEGHDVAPSGADSISSTKKKSPRRWPSYIAASILALLVIAIAILAFIVPDAVQEYSEQAAVIEPTNLSLESITANGVRARIQGNFRLDGSRVANEHVRRIGSTALWLAGQLGSEETQITVRLPDYENIVLGSAVVPPLVLGLKEGQVTQLDFVTDLTTGDLNAVRTIANEWLEGRLKSIRLKGVADLTLKSGLIPLGTHTVTDTVVFEANKIPALPKYNITRFNVHDGPLNASMIADVTLSAFNEYPVDFNVPELLFDILVPGCKPDDFIQVVDAMTHEVHVQPHAEVSANVTGVVRELPDALTEECPHSDSSPLDTFLNSFIKGEPATLFVRGNSHPGPQTPEWITELLSSVTVPVPFPGRSLDNLIRNFSLTDVNFSLPDPDAEPDDPASHPQVSGNILVLVGLPSELNFGINVTDVKATADVLYHSRKMGELNLRKWQAAKSTRIEDQKESLLKIESHISKAPLEITDSDVFSEVIQMLIFGRDKIMLDIVASVDIKVQTALGDIVVKGVPAEGTIPVKPLPKGSFSDIAPQLGTMRVIDSTRNSITLEATISATNPTPYTAQVPYLNIYLMHNDTILGDATVQHLNVVQGLNRNLVVRATWRPAEGGPHGRDVGRNLISQYLSGMNTTLTVKAHRESIPGQPKLCDGLAKLNFTFPTPHLTLPGDAPDGKTHFIRDTTFHFLSSTATFTLVSPLQYNTIYMDFVNATAFYNHTEPVGSIINDLPFAAPPGKSQTPRLPVTWSLGSVGYDAVRNAIGGTLKLDAYADVSVRLGNWQENLWYRGKGIGARVQL